MVDKLTFKTTLKEIPVEIDGKSCVLRELDGHQKGTYLNSMRKRIKLNSKGDIESFVDYSGLESTLLSRCLYDEDGKLIPASVMDGAEGRNGWPSSMLSALFTAAQELSALTEESRKEQEAEAKNS